MAHPEPFTDPSFCEEWLLRLTAASLLKELPLTGGGCPVRGVPFLSPDTQAPHAFLWPQPTGLVFFATNRDNSVV